MGWSVACDRKFQTFVLVGSEGLVAYSCFCCLAWGRRERELGSVQFLAEVSNERNEINLHVMRVVRIWVETWLIV
jgi:hypothetical protein